MTYVILSLLFKIVFDKVGSNPNYSNICLKVIFRAVLYNPVAELNYSINVSVSRTY